MQVRQMVESQRLGQLPHGSWNFVEYAYEFSGNYGDWCINREFP